MAHQTEPVVISNAAAGRSDVSGDDRMSYAAQFTDIIERASRH
jgi:hypothetical protein